MKIAEIKKQLKQDIEKEIVITHKKVTIIASNTHNFLNMIESETEKGKDIEFRFVRADEGTTTLRLFPDRKKPVFVGLIQTAEEADNIAFSLDVIKDVIEF